MAIPSYSLQFLGVGNAFAPELGESAAVLLRDGEPRLLIDCGADVPQRYRERYGRPVPALFVTHSHFDHVGGFERLFVAHWFDEAIRGRLPVFVAAPLLPLLHQRVASHPNALAEGGVNFWQAFQVVPVDRGFWLDGLWFDVFPVRHHALHAAWGLALRGSFVYTGDTRPIPEQLALYANEGETVFHDCALQGNPSHSGVEDVEREYPQALRERMVLYHYGNPDDAITLRGRGFRVAEPGQIIDLPTPVEQSPDRILIRTATP